MYKDNIEYIGHRLNDTVIRHKDGTPLRVRSVRLRVEGILVNTSYLNDDESFSTWMIGELDLSSPPLGYTSHNGVAMYVSRQPKRNDWRQGLRESNLHVANEHHVGRYDLGTYQPLVTSIVGVHKSYQTCKEMMDADGDNYYSIPFSRVFAYHRNGTIWYKGNIEVGGDVLGTPLLHDRYAWLQETLTQELEGNVL